MSEHRVSMFRARLRRVEDPETSSDPQIRELVERLRTVDYAPAPRELFRSELRSQLVAVAPRIVAEGAPETVSTAGPTPRRHVATALRSIPIARPLGVAASVITVLALILGGAVWLSQKSLPGDALYGLKRASENVRLSLTSGDTDRGHEYLSLATTRVQEAQDLAGRTSAIGAGTTADSVLSPHTAALITSTLDSADSDLESGSSLLSNQAVKSRSAKPLDIMTAWAPSQLNRLEQLVSALPAGRTRDRAHSSWNLVSGALKRATVLAPKVRCGCLKITKSDDLGPQPTTSKSAIRSGGTTVTVTPGSPSGPISTPTSGPGTSSTAKSTGSSTPRPGATTPGLPLPTVPTIPILSKAAKSGKPLVSASSCGVNANLGPVGVGVGTCSTGS